MEGIIQWNIRGLKCGSQSFLKTKKCVSKLENVQKTKVFSIQETHLGADDEIPRKLLHFDHLYHILATHAKPDDKGAGILLFINKTENLIKHE